MQPMKMLPPAESYWLIPGTRLLFTTEPKSRNVRATHLDIFSLSALIPSTGPNVGEQLHCISLQVKGCEAAKGQIFYPQYDRQGELKTVQEKMSSCTFNVFEFTSTLGSSPPKLCSHFILRFLTDQTFYTLLKTNLKLHFCNFFVDLKNVN